MIFVPDEMTYRMPESPSTVDAEIDTLNEMFSNIHLLSGTFPPDFYEKLKQRQEEHQVVC